MPRIKFTKAAIERIKAPDPSGKQTIFWDADLKGFGLLVSGVTTNKSFIAQRTLPGGNSRRITIGAVAEIALDAARHEAADVIHQMRTADPKATRRSAAKWTTAHALDEFLKARPSLKANTAHYYRALVGNNLSPWLPRPIGSITGDEVEDQHRKIQARVEQQRRAQAAAKGRDTIQPSGWQSIAGGHMANASLRVFGIVYNFVSERDPTLPPNPVRRLRRQWFKEPRRERVVRTEELPAFYRAIGDLPNRVTQDYLKLLLFSGLRRREAAGLRWDDIDFVQRLIRLPASRTKNSRRLDLPMSSFVRDLLVARRAIGRESQFVFASLESQTGYIAGPDAAFAQIAEQTGIYISCHDLRRTFITIAEWSDILPMALKALVNHSTGTDVTAGYTIMVAERLRDPAERVCTKMMELCEIAPSQAENVTRIG